MLFSFRWTTVLLELQLDRKTGRASFKLKILFFLIKISLLNVKLCRYKDQNSCSAALKTSLTKALSFIFCEFVNFSFERVPNPRKGNDCKNKRANIQFPSQNAFAFSSRARSQFAVTSFHFIDNRECIPGHR